MSLSLFSGDYSWYLMQYVSAFMGMKTAFLKMYLTLYFRKWVRKFLLFSSGGGGASFYFSLACTAGASRISVVWCFLHCGKCPLFPGEVGIPFVTSFSGLCPGEEMWWVMGPLWSQCCLQQDAASSAILSEVSQVPPLDSTAMDEDRLGLFLHLWPCSLPSNGGCQTSVDTPLCRGHCSRV